MARETSHVTEFPAQVLMDLAESRPFRTQTKDGHLHVCFEKKLKQSAFNNFLLTHTPYRYSLLGKPRATETKTWRTKRANKARITTERRSSTLVSFPKIQQSSESLIRENDAPEYNTKQHDQDQDKDATDRGSDGEHSSCDFLSCGSITIAEESREINSPPRTAVRECCRSRTLPLILNRENSSFHLRRDVRNFKSLNKLPQGEGKYYNKSLESICSYRGNSSSSNEYTTVMEDGAKVTVKQQRLFIEVFMPRTF